MEQQKNLKLLFRHAKNAILKTLQGYPWWVYVQDETRKSLAFIIDNIQELGIPFRNSFVEIFKFEHTCRLLNKQAIPTDKPGILVGTQMSEEAYHSGILPTKILLKLDDWFQPNDSDVHACMSLCHHIDQLEKIGLFLTIDPQSNSTKVKEDSIFSKMFQQKA